MQGKTFTISSYRKLMPTGTTHDGVHYTFDYNLDIKEYGNDAKFLYASVLRASIPKTWYLIVAGRNTFTLTEPGYAAQTITFPTGNYTATSFATQLQASLQAAAQAGSTYTVSFSIVTGKLTYTCTPAIAASITLPTAIAEGIHDQLGFLAGSTNTFAAGTLTSTRVCSYQAQDTVCICSNLCKSNSSILQDITSSGVPFGSSITWENPDVIGNSKKMLSTVSTVNFTLRDIDGHTLDTNSQAWSLTILIFRANELMLRDIWAQLAPKIDTVLTERISKINK